MNYEKIIANIEKEIKDFLKDKKAIIGISGGLDSAVVATLCARALGKENVYGILMPYKNQNTKDAELLINQLQIPFEKINIERIVDNYDFLKPTQLGKGNIMARTRMTILYDFANQLNGLVVGTGNKSEIAIGYFTKYGDGGVDLEIIGELYKTEVFEIAKKLNVPKSIIKRKPSAGLWKNQTDEEEIGVSYAELDKYLRGGQIAQDKVMRIRELKNTAKHKQKMPPILMIRE